MKKKINPKEQQVLNVLWSNSESLTAKQISEQDTSLVMSTIQSTLQKLLKKELVKVTDIVYSGTVLTRRYKNTITKEEFIIQQFNDIKITELISQFLGSESKTAKEKDIKAIEDFIHMKKKEME